MASVTSHCSLITTVCGAMALLTVPVICAQPTAARQSFDARASSWLAVNELDADHRTFTDLSLWPKGYGYVTENVIGDVADGVDPEWSMLRLQLDPGSIFPFTVAPVGSRDSSIRLGGHYDLQNVRWPGDNGNFIQVTEVGPTSFTFTTLEGHFDGVGATIQFETVVRDGKVFLRQTGYAVDINPFTATVAPPGAIYLVWPQQAANLTQALTSEWRSPFPTAERPRIISPMLGSQTVPADQSALNNRRRLARRQDDLGQRLLEEHNQSMQRLFVDMERARVAAAADRQRLYDETEQIWREMNARHQAWEAERQQREARLQEWNREVEKWLDRGTPETQDRIRSMQIEQEALLRERTQRQFEEMRWHRESLSNWLDDLNARSRSASSGQEPASRIYRPPPSAVDPAFRTAFPRDNQAFAAAQRGSRNEAPPARVEGSSTRSASRSGSTGTAESSGRATGSSRTAEPGSGSSRRESSGTTPGSTGSVPGSGGGRASQWREETAADGPVEGDTFMTRSGRRLFCPAPCTDTNPPND